MKGLPWDDPDSDPMGDLRDVAKWLAEQPPICYICGTRHVASIECPDFIRLCSECHCFHRASEEHGILMWLGRVPMPLVPRPEPSEPAPPQSASE